MSARRQLIYDSMEHECVCAEAGLHGASAAHCHRSGWQRRATQLLVLLLAVALVLVVAVVVLALLVIIGLERDTHARHHERLPPCPATVEIEKQTSSKPLDQNDRKIPRAMLTVADDQSSGDYLQWETEKGRAFHLGGFNYTDGNLVVPRNGLYRVFLQVTFEIPAQRENLFLYCTVLALSESYLKDVEILKTEDFVKCDKDNMSCRKTLYTSALFTFEENTRLKVKADQPNLIVKDEKLVFFGAELLPD